MTLYCSLRHAQREHQEMLAAASTYANARSSLETMAGQAHQALEQPIFDLAEVQRAIFHVYKNNPLLDQAISSDERSVSATLRELASVNKGLRRLLPRRKDQAHNERVEALQELVPMRWPNVLRKDGIFTFDNPITAGIGSATFIYAASSLMLPFMPGPDDPRVLATVPKVMAGVLTPIAMLHFASQRLEPQLPYEAAEYLDSKIRQFYR